MPVLRCAKASDAEALVSLARNTWLDMSLDDFGMSYTAHDVDSFHAEKNSLSVVGGRLRDPTVKTWVIDDDGRLVGYADAGPCDLRHPAVEPCDMELNRLYVLRSHQRKGWGRRLVEAALRWMGSTPASAHWVGVWSGNVKAQRLYGTYGFEKVGEYDFAVGGSIDRDFIMRRAATSR